MQYNIIKNYILIFNNKLIYENYSYNHEFSIVFLSLCVAQYRFLFCDFELYLNKTE